MRLAREGAWVTAGKVVAILASLVGVRALTELLGPYDYGVLALGMTLTQLGNQLSFGPLSQAAGRFYMPSIETREVFSLVRATRRYAVAGAAVVGLVAVAAAAASFLSGDSGMALMAIAIAAFSIFAGFSAIIRFIQNACRQRAVVAAHEAAEAVLRFGMAALFVICLTSSAGGALLGYAVSAVLIFVSQAYWFKKLNPVVDLGSNDDSKWRKKLLHYAWPFCIWGLFFWAQRASERWALAVFSGPSEVGVYAVLFQIGFQPMIIASDLVTRFAAPIVFQRAGDATSGTRLRSMIAPVRGVAAVAVVFTLLAFGAAMLLHDIVFRVFTAAEFHSSSYLLPWVVLAGGILAIGQTISLSMMGMLRTREMLWAKVLPAVLGIILSFFGAAAFGVVGVVGATISTAIASTLLMSLAASRYYRQHTRSDHE